MKFVHEPHYRHQAPRLANGVEHHELMEDMMTYVETPIAHEEETTHCPQHHETLELFIVQNEEVPYPSFSFGLPGLDLNSPVYFYKQNSLMVHPPIHFPCYSCRLRARFEIDKIQPNHDPRLCNCNSPFIHPLLYSDEAKERPNIPAKDTHGIFTFFTEDDHLLKRPYQIEWRNLNTLKKVNYYEYIGQKGLCYKLKLQIPQEFCSIYFIYENAHVFNWPFMIEVQEEGKEPYIFQNGFIKPKHHHSVREKFLHINAKTRLKIIPCQEFQPDSRFEVTALNQRPGQGLNWDENTGADEVEIEIDD